MRQIQNDALPDNVKKLNLVYLFGRLNRISIFVLQIANEHNSATYNPYLPS